VPGLPDWRRRIDVGEPAVDLALSFVAGYAVPLLDLAHELLGISFDLIEVIVGELAPLLASPAFELRPLAFGNVADRKSGV
jgi:hypothetical protein